MITALVLWMISFLAGPKPPDDGPMVPVSHVVHRIDRRGSRR